MRIDALRAADGPDVEALLDEAFGTDRHARTAYRLREGVHALPHLRLAARAPDGALVGSLQCWPIQLVTATCSYPLVLLGPVAVARSHRSAGIGTALIHAALARAPTTPMLLIGDTPYYGRFGFTPERTGGWQVPGPVDRARLLARAADALPAHGTLGPAALDRAAA